MRAEAIKHIMRHEVEDTFYMIDLGNVTRMFKVTRCMCMWAGGRGDSVCVRVTLHCRPSSHHLYLAHGQHKRAERVAEAAA